MPALLLVLLLLAAPALAGTQVAIIYNNTTGEIMSITIPDDDRELDDPAYQRKGGTQIRIPLKQFMALSPATIQSIVPIPLNVPPPKFLSAAEAALK